MITSIIVACTLLSLTHAIPQSQSYGPPNPTASAPPGFAAPQNGDVARLYNLTRRFFDNMIVPFNLQQLDGLNSTIFAEDVTGRVSDSRKFLGRELNTEYVYGAFTGGTVNETRKTLIGFPRSTHTMRFAANVPDKSAFITEIMSFDIKLLGQTIPVQMDVWFRWNENDEVKAYDARFVYFDWLMANGMKTLAVKYSLLNIDTVEEQVKSMLVEQICETATANCQGALQQYDNATDCQQKLMTKRLGAPFEFGVDSVLCRSLHEGMLTLKPESHCPHVGMQGGDMCTDNLDYLTYVMDQDFFEVDSAGW